jgi:hypothetical protein
MGTPRKKLYENECRLCEQEQRQLRDKLGHRKSSDLRFLLTNPKARDRRDLYTYVDRTNRFHDLA